MLLLSYLFAFNSSHPALSVQLKHDYYLYLNMILPLVKSYGLISTPTLSPGRIRDIVHSHLSRDSSQYFVPIFQLYSEHSIGQGLYNGTILFNKCLFRHTIFGSAKIGNLTRNKKIWGRILSFLWTNCNRIAKIGETGLKTASPWPNLPLSSLYKGFEVRGP